MAVDAAAPRAQLQARPLLLQRAAAVPTWVWLAGIVGASTSGRLIAAVGRIVPFYLPDEYMYPALARSLAEHGRPMIRGVSVHFPALLEPLVTAPIWLVTKDPQAAVRLTQGLHAVVVSIAAVPAYLLARRVGLSRAFGLGIGVLAVAVPDTVYAASMLSDALAYPLALGAVCAGAYLFSAPTWRAQLAFVALSGLAIFARIEYVALPFAVVLGAVAADRGRLLLTVKKLWPSLVTFVAPPALAFAFLGPQRLLGPYSHARQQVAPLALLHWVGREAMLLVYSSGWVIVPGALIGIGYACLRPKTRTQIGFAVMTAVLALALLVESAQIATTDSQRFQERYVFVLVPMLAVAFGLYVRRGFPRKLVAVCISTALLLLAARIPLSGYAVGHGKDDSPTLWAVLRLETAVTTGNGALAIALLGAVLSGLATLVAWRRAGGMLALTVAVAACCALSAGAASVDVAASEGMRHMLPADIRWIDHARLGPVDIISPPGARRDETREALFWNLSAKRVLQLGSPPIDQFTSEHVQVARDGRLLNVTRPFAVQTYASLLSLAGIHRIRHEPMWDLYRPVGTPRLRFLVSGRYLDGWLAARGAFTLWTRTGGTLHVVLSLPRGFRTVELRLGARTLRLRPGTRMSLRIAVPPRVWSLHYSTRRPAYFPDRAVSVVATDVKFFERP